MVEFVRKKPFGIAVLMAILGFLGGVGTLAASGILIFSLFGDGPFFMNGEEVGKAEFLRFAVPFTLVYLLGCLVALSIALAIHREHPRSRPLLLAYSTLPILAVPLAGVLGLPMREVLASSIPVILVPLVAWLYLYRKESVAEYFASLSRD